MMFHDSLPFRSTINHVSSAGAPAQGSGRVSCQEAGTGAAGSENEVSTTSVTQADLLDDEDEVPILTAPFTAEDLLLSEELSFSSPLVPPDAPCSGAEDEEELDECRPNP